MNSPPALPIEWVLRLRVQCDAPQPLGEPEAGTRVNFPIVGGDFEGPRLRGAVLPGADFYLQRADGLGVLDARYSLRTDDGVVINVHNRGLLREEPGEPPYYVCHCVPEFQAPPGCHDWLNREMFAGVVKYPEPGQVVIDVYRLL